MKRKKFYFVHKILVDKWSYDILMSLKSDKQPIGMVVRKLLLEHNYNMNRKFSQTLWKKGEYDGTEKETYE